MKDNNFIKEYKENNHLYGISLKLDLKLCFIEEDLFPKIFAKYEEKPYGILFYNQDNKESYDSNHAVIYKDKIKDLKIVLKDIIDFYTEKGCNPIIYQSMLDNDWFEEIKENLENEGFRTWTEQQKYMLLLEENKIVPNPKIKVKKIESWNDSLKKIFEEAEEPWEIDVAKKSMENPNEWMFVAFLEEKPIGVLYGHHNQNVCRCDYLLISKKHRKIGAGRTLFYTFVEWVKKNGIYNSYIWPAGQQSERIYFEGGYRVVESRASGRAVFEKSA